MISFGSTDPFPKNESAILLCLGKKVKILRFKKKNKISGVQYIKYKKGFLFFFVPTCVSALISIKYGEMSQFEEGHFLRSPDFA